MADSAQAQSSSLAKDLSSQIITTSSASVSFSAPNTEEILTSDTVFPIICSALEEGRNSSDPRKAEVFKLLSMFVAPAKVANVAQLEEQNKHLAEKVAQLEEQKKHLADNLENTTIDRNLLAKRNESLNGMYALP